MAEKSCFSERSTGVCRMARQLTNIIVLSNKLLPLILTYLKYNNKQLCTISLEGEML